MKKILALVSVAVLVFAGYLFYRHNSVPAPQLVTETVDIQGTIRDIGELATAEYAFTITKISEKPNMTISVVPIPFTSSKVLYSYEGIIKAGIQFSEIEITQNTAQKKIFVHLPDAEFLSTELDNDSLIVYDEKYSPFNSFTFADMNSSQEEAKADAQSAAIENGLLDRANENAKVIIESTIGALVDLNEYEIVFH